MAGWAKEAGGGEGETARKQCDSNEGKHLVGDGRAGWREAWGRQGGGRGGGGWGSGRWWGPCREQRKVHLAGMFFLHSSLARNEGGGLRGRHGPPESSVGATGVGGGVGQGGGQREQRGSNKGCTGSTQGSADIGEYSGVIKGDTRSLDYSLFLANCSRYKHHRDIIE